ncbi:spermidine synthase [Desulfacinum hydrothermale DSM 13146]|uniref:Polyamine aminopropyltransferase n=1 Tax=Desulfacinum hydrothermale DSM 13146 TaxID=1121390 RepID=A0A1W1XQ30_9BACT|nr:polyamine aminopropyltransferase [Desulfacinum hydrothermale]SMC25977.1 spermidine synthase [Desulfacinum hydrothermale DSM 13146]
MAETSVASSGDSTPVPAPAGARRVLQCCVVATGLAGIVAEYTLSTLASYLLGDTIFQWVMTISVFLFAMGVGSRTTGRIQRRVLESFVATEYALSLAVAVAVPASYALAAWPDWLPVALYGFTFLIGFLIGMEIPLVIRINAEFETLSLNLSNVLEKDYIGALLGGVFFAFIGLPRLGLSRTPLVLGAVNYLVAAFFWKTFRHRLPSRFWSVGAVAVLVLLAAVAVGTGPVMLWGEQKRYKDLVIYEEQSPYQKIVMTQWRDYFWIYLDGHQQLSSFDEARYHECLVHPAMLAAKRHGTVLILGGGDGCAAREVLKYPDVKRITLVDLDPAMTRLAREHPLVVAANDGALNDPRVRIVHEDAYQFVQRTDAVFQVVLIDLPDPRNPGLERLYGVEFYRMLRRLVPPGGVIVTQATSPVFSREAFWCIHDTMRAAGWKTVPLHANVPTMGEWGWVMGMREETDHLPERLAEVARRRLPPTRYLDPEVLRSLFVFGKDLRRGPEPLLVHSEKKPVLYRAYEQGLWETY